MKRLVDLPRWWGPVTTIVFTTIYHLGSLAFGYSPAVMPLAVFLALGSVTGLRAGLICAVWVSGYALYAIPDLSRVIQIVLGSVGIAVIVGLETRALRAALIEAKANQIKADIVDSFNGNVKLALGAIDILDSLRFGWEAIPDAVRFGMVERARGKIADQVTLARSFRDMAHDREIVLGHNGDD